MISQKTDLTHLAYATSYDCDYFITSDDALIRYKIPRRLNESDYVKPETLPLEAFKWKGSAYGVPFHLDDTGKKCTMHQQSV